MLLKDPHQVQSVLVECLFLKQLFEDAAAMFDSVKGNSNILVRVKMMASNDIGLTNAFLVQDD
jgi:hypothetical protein